MNAHISKEEYRAADQKVLGKLLDFVGKFDGNEDSEEFELVKQQMLDSGLTTDGFLDLFGDNLAEVIAQRAFATVGIQLLTDTAKYPTYANEQDACADIYADEDVVIRPGRTKAVKTGLAFVIPSGFVCHIYPRSGLSAKTGLRLANSVGVIDAGYRDEVKVLCWNSGTEDIHIEKGMRIAQIDIQSSPAIDFVEVEDAKSFGNDRGGGFGHTGLFDETVKTDG